MHATHSAKIPMSDLQWYPWMINIKDNVVLILITSLLLLISKNCASHFRKIKKQKHGYQIYPWSDKAFKCTLVNQLKLCVQSLYETKYLAPSGSITLLLKFRLCYKFLHQWVDRNSSMMLEPEINKLLEV